MAEIILDGGIPVEMKKISELPGVNTLSGTDLVLASDSEGNAKNITYNLFLDPVKQGIGTAYPDSSPIAGISTYNVSEAGTYTNFGAIVVTAEDLEGGMVQIRFEDGEWKKVIIPINVPGQSVLDPDDATSLPYSKAVADWVYKENSAQGYYGEKVPEVCNGIDHPSLRTIIINQEITTQVEKVIIYGVKAGSITLGAFVKDGLGNIYRDHGLSVSLTEGLNVVDFAISPGQYVGYFKNADAVGIGGVGRISGDTSADYSFYSYTVGVSTTPVALIAESHQIRYGIKALSKEEYASFDVSVTEAIKNNGETEDIYNKNIVVFGDSISSTATHAQNYADRVSAVSKANSYTNVAIGGATWTWKAGTVDDPNPLPSTDSNVISNQVLKYIDMATSDYPDLAIFSAGINDVFADYPIGNISTIFNTALGSLNKQEFVAAIRYAVETFRTAYPKAFVVMLTPLHSTVTGRKYDDALPYSEALKECASRLNVPVIDCFNGVQMPELRATELLSDGLHPNGLGKELQFRFVWNWLKNNYYKMA